MKSSKLRTVPMAYARTNMEDFNIGITLDVYEGSNKLKTYKSDVLSDETIHMIMEDIAMKLNEEEENGETT